MRVARTKVIEIAKSFIGTPYHHQGRVKGLRGGIDCCGLIICVAWELGISDYDIDGYSMVADGVDLTREFETNCQRVAQGRPGDIALIRVAGVARHCAILSFLGDKENSPSTPNTQHLTPTLSIIHSARTYKGCVEHVLDPVLESNIMAYFAYPGVTDDDG